MLDRLKNVDMSHLKTCAKNYASHAKSYAKTMGTKAIDQAKYMGSKKVVLAGRTVNPYVAGAAAIAILSGVAYLLLRNRSRKMQMAGMTGMERQEYPVK